MDSGTCRFSGILFIEVVNFQKFYGDDVLVFTTQYGKRGQKLKSRANIKKKERGMRDESREGDKIRVGDENPVLDKTLIITTLLCLAPMFLGIIVYRSLPERIPSHFDFNGNVTGDMNKNGMVFLMPLLFAAVNVFCHFSINVDPKRRNAPPAMKFLLKWLISALACLAVPMSLLKGLQIDVSITHVIMLFLGFLCIICGDYMPKCRQNYTVAIKTPWTLNSEENWKKTHHMAGYLWMGAGALMLLGTFFANPIVSLGVPLALGIVPAVYSYLLYRKGI